MGGEGWGGGGLTTRHPAVHPLTHPSLLPRTRVGLQTKGLWHPCHLLPGLLRALLPRALRPLHPPPPPPPLYLASVAMEPQQSGSFLESLTMLTDFCPSLPVPDTRVGSASSRGRTPSPLRWCWLTRLFPHPH